MRRIILLSLLLSLLLPCLFSITSKVVRAQENSDWWHTDYENQTAVGGANQSPTTTTETLPVAGTAEVTYAVLAAGLGLISLGIFIQKRQSV